MATQEHSEGDITNRADLIMDLKEATAEELASRQKLRESEIEINEVKTLEHAWQHNRIWLMGVVVLPLMALLVVWLGMLGMGFQQHEFLLDPWFYAVPAFTALATGVGLLRYRYWLIGRRDLMKKASTALNMVALGLAVLAFASL